MTRKLALVALMSIVLIGGCGDTAAYWSALGKLVSNPSDPPIGNLTTAELVALSSHAAELGALLQMTPEQIAQIPEITTEQAQAAVDFMDQQNITNVSEIQALIDEIANGNPDNIEMPIELQELIDAF